MDKFLFFNAKGEFQHEIHYPEDGIGEIDISPKTNRMIRHSVTH